MDEDKMKTFSQMRSRMTTPLCLHEHETSFTGQGGELKFKAHLGKVPLLCHKPKPKPKTKKHQPLSPTIASSSFALLMYDSSFFAVQK